MWLPEMEKVMKLVSCYSIILGLIKVHFTFKLVHLQLSLYLHALPFMFFLLLSVLMALFLLFRYMVPNSDTSFGGILENKKLVNYEENRFPPNKNWGKNNVRCMI